MPDAASSATENSLAQAVLAQLRDILPTVLARTGPHGRQIVLHILPQASAVRIELPPEEVIIRRTS